jgi:hypothetical protein
VTELLSTDRDFRRFSTIVVRDPFAPSRVGEARVRYRARRAARASTSR